jgi:alpha-methylacyl-CoA racemase
MVDGSASLMTLIYGSRAAGYWSDERGTNRLDSGSHWYNVYETRDGKYVGIGAIEGRFYRNALKLLGLDEADSPQHERARWPELRERFAAAFKTRTRDEWVELAKDADVCISPVLSLAEAPLHPHLQARKTFVEVEGVVQPAPAPRFSRTPPATPERPPAIGEHTDEVLAGGGFTREEIAGLRAAGAIT